jgi:hypothetical protein
MVGNKCAAAQMLDLPLCVQLLPMENHSGRKKVEADGGLCERKNGHGVDINRNYAVDWGVKEADYQAFEESPGDHAFSEPEAQIVRDFAQQSQPHVWITVHSGAQCSNPSKVWFARTGVKFSVSCCTR